MDLYNKYYYYQCQEYLEENGAPDWFWVPELDNTIDWEQKYQALTRKSHVSDLHFDIVASFFHQKYPEYTMSMAEYVHYQFQQLQDYLADISGSCPASAGGIVYRTGTPGHFIDYNPSQDLIATIENSLDLRSYARAQGEYFLSLSDARIRQSRKTWFPATSVEALSLKLGDPQMQDDLKYHPINSMPTSFFKMGRQAGSPTWRSMQQMIHDNWHIFASGVEPIYTDTGTYFRRETYE